MSACHICHGDTDGFICRACNNQLARDIGDMTSLLHEVSVAATGQANVYRANGKPQPVEDETWLNEYRKLPARLRSPHGRQTLIATRSVVNLPAREMLYDAYDTLLAWASRLGADPISSKNVVAWLLKHGNDIRHHEDAAGIFDEITYLHAQLEKFVDNSPSRVYAGPCHATLLAETSCPCDCHLGGEHPPACTIDTGSSGIDGLPSCSPCRSVEIVGRCEHDLYGWRGADYIDCDGHRGADSDDEGCGARHSAKDRRAWFVAELDDALMPIDDLRNAMPPLFPDMPIPPAPTWRSWVFRGQIKPHGVVNGVELYRGGEVFKLIEEWITGQKEGGEKRRGRKRETRAS